jgi:hypothetical protein
MRTTSILAFLLCLIAATGVAQAAVNIATSNTATGFRITNNGDAVNVTLTPSAFASGSDTIPASALTLTPASASIAAGASKDIAVGVNVPANQAAGLYTGTIAILADDGASSATISIPYFIMVGEDNSLTLDRVSVSIDGDKETATDGEDFEIKPGSEVEITIKIENTNDLLDMEDVEVTVESDDLDWDENEDIGTIKDGDDETITFSFTVPDDADEDDSPFSVDITLEGQDEDGNDQGESMSIDLELDKESNEYSLTMLSLSPTTVQTCAGKSVTLKTTVTNTGSRDQNYGAIRVTNDDLDLEKVVTGIALDENDKASKDITFALPSDVKIGSYDLQVEAFTSTNAKDLTDIEFVTLNVVACATTPTVPTTPTTPTTGTDDKDDGMAITPTPVVTGTVVGTATGAPQKGLFGESLSTGLLVAIIVLLLVLIGLGVAVLAKKQN